MSDDRPLLVITDHSGDPERFKELGEWADSMDDADPWSEYDVLITQDDTGIEKYDRADELADEIAERVVDKLSNGVDQ